MNKPTHSQKILFFSITLMFILITISQEKELEIKGSPTFTKDLIEQNITEKINEILATEQENIYVADTQNSRIQVFNNQGNFSTTFGERGTNLGQFRMPVGVLKKDEYIYVMDKGNHRIQVFNEDYIPLYEIGKGILKYPLGFDIYKERIYVANTFTGNINVFTLGGGHIFSFGNWGKEDGQLRHPSDITANEEGVFVLDTDNNRVQKFTHEGKFILKWGEYTRDEHGMRFPMGIEGYNNTIYVADTRNSRIKMYSSNGTFIKAFGEHGKEKEQFRFGTNIWEADGFLYIADTKNNRIKKYYPNGTLYGFWGSFGREKGQFRLPGNLRYFGSRGSSNSTTIVNILLNNTQITNQTKNTSEEV